MLKKRIDTLVKPLANKLQQGPMATLGINKTMRLAKRYNRWQYGDHHRHREQLFQQRFEELLQSNGGLQQPALTMEDGWVLDTSGTLPFLDELLAEAEQVIDERGGKSDADARYRAFFRNLISVPDLYDYPSFLNFALSSEVLSTASQYLGFVPTLSKTLPPGVRFVESHKALDAQAHLPPRDSQLFHIDPYDTPMVYVIVLLKDVTPKCGPFTWLSASVSQRAKAQLNYHTKGRPYRLSDEEIYSVVDPEETQVLAYPRGTVLFIDPSQCFHYGSRDAVQPRYQMMYGFVSPCRADFSETIMETAPFPQNDTDSALRRLVLDKTYTI